jgi:hypothetical protein
MLFAADILGKRRAKDGKKMRKNAKSRVYVQFAH